MIPIKMDAVTKTPDIDGVAKAWVADMVRARELLECNPENDSTLIHWVVEAPWAHPAWHSYSIFLLHLRPMPGVGDPHIYIAGATHEIIVHAMNPDTIRQEVIENGFRKDMWLQPANFASQFIAESDDAAKAKVEDAVRRICAGTLNPDTDYIRQWMHLFGDNMIKDKRNAGATRIVARTSDGQTAELVIPPKPGPQDLN